MQTANTPPSRQPVQIALAQGLFLLNTAIWIFFLILFISDQVKPSDAVSSWVVPLLMVGNALAMLVCGFGLQKRSSFFYILSVAVIGLNILLTVTDQVGLFDYITLLIDLVILILLFASRKAFSASRKGADVSRLSQ